MELLRESIALDAARVAGLDYIHIQVSTNCQMMGPKGCLLLRVGITLIMIIYSIEQTDKRYPKMYKVDDDD